MRSAALKVGGIHVTNHLRPHHDFPATLMPSSPVYSPFGIHANHRQIIRQCQVKPLDDRLAAFQAKDGSGPSLGRGGLDSPVQREKAYFDPTLTAMEGQGQVHSTGFAENQSADHKDRICPFVLGWKMIRLVL